MRSAVVIGLGIAFIHSAIALAQPPDESLRAGGKKMPNSAASKPTNKPGKAGSRKGTTVPAKNPGDGTPSSLSQELSRSGGNSNFSLSGPYVGLKYIGNE